MHVGHVYAIPDPKGNRQIVERIDFEILPVSRVLSFGKRFSRNLGVSRPQGRKQPSPSLWKRGTARVRNGRARRLGMGIHALLLFNVLCPVVVLLYARTGFGIWDLAGRPLRSLRKMECPSEANRKKEK